MDSGDERRLRLVRIRDLPAAQAYFGDLLDWETIESPRGGIAALLDPRQSALGLLDPSKM
jgi:hypothetical protein